MQKILEKQLRSLIKNFRLRNFTPIHGGKNCFNLNFLNQAYSYDLSEIDLLDSLHDPQRFILDAEQRAAELFEVKKTFFSVNGASACLLASCLALRNNHKEKLKALVPVNAHVSLLSGLLLAEIEPIWYQPIWDSKWGVYQELDFDNLEYLLKKNSQQICAVFVVSPTYEGQQMNLQKLKQLIKFFNLERKGLAEIIFIVDEAHGAHLSLLNNKSNKTKNKQTAIASQADLIIHSAHKSLGALNQSALLHLNSNKLSEQKLRKSLNLIQTTSPSFLFLFNLIDCIDSLRESLELLKLQFRESLKFRRKLEKTFDFILMANSDPSRLVINFNNRKIKSINRILKSHKLEPELENKNWLLFLLPLRKNFPALKNSLLPAFLQVKKLSCFQDKVYRYSKPSAKSYPKNLRSAFFSEEKYFNYTCPPGILDF